MYRICAGAAQASAAPSSRLAPRRTDRPARIGLYSGARRAFSALAMTRLSGGTLRHVGGYLGSYATLGLLLVVGAAVFGGALSANRLLRPARPAEPFGKRETYECGLDPVGGDWAQAQLR